MPGELLIVTGPPGAGKSTMGEQLAAARSPSALVEGDAFFQFLRAGRIEPWVVESAPRNETVTRAAAAATGQFARDVWTVYDGILGAWFVPTFMAETGLETAHYVVLLPSIERCLQRVATRVGHRFDTPLRHATCTASSPSPRSTPPRRTRAAGRRRNRRGADPAPRQGRLAAPLTSARRLDGLRKCATSQGRSRDGGPRRPGDRGPR